MRKVYVAHPFGGSDENKNKAQEIIHQLVVRYPDTCFISPIHTFGWMYGHVDEYVAMEWCFALLEDCDKLILCPGWERSPGCRRERAYAKICKIPIVELPNTEGECHG